MKNVLKTLTNAFRRIFAITSTIAMHLLSFVPRRLPQRDIELPPFLDRICKLADVPVNDSFEQAICTIILHTPAHINWVSDRKFVKELQSSISKQVSYNRISDIKARAKAAASEKEVN